MSSYRRLAFLERRSMKELQELRQAAQEVLAGAQLSHADQQRRMGELVRACEEAFAKIDEQVNRLDSRLAALERRRWRWPWG